MKASIYLFFLAFVIVACNTDKDPLYDEVMEIHDAVMPKVSDMSKLGRKLKKQQTGLDSSSLVINQKAIADLEHAEEAMFDWMNKFESSKKGPEHKAYLEEEKVKISKVSDMMLESIDQAQKVLSEYDQK
jgi:hypothetical protein